MIKITWPIPRNLFRFIGLGRKRSSYLTGPVALFLIATVIPLRANNITHERRTYLFFSPQELKRGEEKRLVAPALGSPISLEMAFGDSHFFKIDLNSDHYLHLVVSSRRVNMAVSLLGPNGERLLDVDTSPVSASEESLHFVAPAAGTYEIKVNLGRSPSVDSKGTYEFLIKQLRNALPDDRKRAAATQAASDGDRFRDTEKRDEAIKEYEKAIELWQQLGESKEEGKALYKLGLFYGALDQNPVARNFYMQALPLMRHGTSEEQAALNVNLGISNLNAGEVYEARVNFEQALSLFQQADVPRGIAYTLGEMGRASYLLGENQEALTYYHQALAAWRDGRLTESLSKRGEGIVLDLIGRVQVSLGQNSEALANFEAARAILEESIDKRSYANTLLDLGRYHVILGAPEKALPFYDKALTVLGNDNPSGRAEVLAYVGEAQAALKLFSSAIKNLNDALLLQQALNDRAGEGDTLHKLG